jgi:GNAT superfamily N-acetyltransferase
MTSSDVTRCARNVTGEGCGLTESDLLVAGERNAAAALAHFTRSSGGKVTEAAGILLAASPHPYCGTFHNAAVRIDPAAEPDTVLRLADEVFGALGRGYVLWVARDRDADLEKHAVAAGMALRRPVAGAPDMVLTAALPAIAPATGVTVEDVVEPGQVATFGTIVAGAYTVRAEPSAAGTGADRLPDVPVVDGAPQPPEAALAMFSRPESVLAPDAYAVIARVDGEPVSCAVLYRTGVVAGVYWVSTLATARRRGLAALVTAAVVNEGFRRGCRMAVLQASSMGVGLYRQMGFVEYHRHRRYVRTPQDAIRGGTG